MVIQLKVLSLSLKSTASPVLVLSTLEYHHHFLQSQSLKRDTVGFHPMVQSFLPMENGSGSVRVVCDFFPLYY